MASANLISEIRLAEPQFYQAEGLEASQWLAGRRLADARREAKAITIAAGERRGPVEGARFSAEAAASKAGFRIERAAEPRTGEPIIHVAMLVLAR